MTSKVRVFIEQINSKPSVIKKESTVDDKDNYVESEHCVQYHRYLEILTKMEYDKDISYLTRIVAGELRKSIDKRHFNECVEPELNYNRNQNKVNNNNQTKQ